MRIVYDYQIFSAQKYGGISRYFVELARNLAILDDVDTHIVSPMYTNLYLRDLSNLLGVSGKSFPTIRRTTRIRNGINQLLSPLIMSHLQPDIVHETYYSSKRFAPYKSKVVLTVYDMIHERFSEDFSSNDKTSITKLNAVQRADHIICISEHTRKDLIELFGVSPGKTTVIHLGFSLISSDVKGEVSPPNERPYLLYVGNRGGYKNYDGLLLAYASNKELQSQYDIVAFGGGAMSSKERRFIDKLGINVERIRHISGDDAVLMSLYRNAALFVYPSLYEGFGIPPLEAMSFDCPVVCSNQSSIPEVVGDAGEYFDPYSAESISHAIDYVLSSAERCQTLIERGRERIKCFSWNSCAEQTLDVYKRLLS